MYSENDWRSYSELYHHGILGQKWGHKNGPPYPLAAGDHSASEKKAGWMDSLKGAYRSAKKNYYNEEIKMLDGPRYRGETDNEYNFRQKQIKTFKDEIAKIDQANLTDKLRKAYTPSDNYKYTKTTANCKEEIDAIRKDERYQKALDGLKPFEEETNKYYNDEKLVNKYTTLAGIVGYREFDDWGDSTMEDVVWSYKHDDLDQNDGNSFSLYMLDRGVNVNSYNKSLWNAEKSFESTRQTLAKEALGNHYDDIVGRNEVGRDVSAGHVMEWALRGADDVFAQPIEIYQNDVEHYKKELKEAKKLYPQYKDI